MINNIILFMLKKDISHKTKNRKKKFIYIPNTIIMFLFQKNKKKIGSMYAYKILFF